MERHEGRKREKENGASRSMLAWLLLAGLGALMVRQFKNITPVAQRYWRMERM